jgi:4-hydroxy-tetrahydrodipicolinate synthase
MKQAFPVFEGVGTAIITPFRGGAVDYDAFGLIIEEQIAAGIDALVVCGTTGEASTLTDEEHRSVIEYAVKASNGRVPIVAGTGSNDVAYAIDLSLHACEVGADALLQVTPYYNKASQLGLVKYFSAIADEVDRPVILYNVPSRTGCGIGIDAYKELADHPNIVATKEACGDISFIAKLAEAVEGRMDIYSGNDDQVVPILSMGGAGVISVISNLMPKETSEMCHRWFDGDVAGAAKMQCDLLPLINALFCETNPIPVKAAMAAMGWCQNYLRLPLTPMESAHEETLRGLMRAHNLI